MSLVAGTRLGPYEILSPLGAGGMGEVYRARDTKLNRDVAVKVLSSSAVAGDPERQARFEREARVLAALNHPNIAHIHGLEDSSGIPALIMELVEGPTLADRIANGPIRVEDGLRIARQIAEALAAAHEQGIVHRDLKPANIKVRPDGFVKVLDFGLAKIGAREVPAQGLSELRTEIVSGTRAGIILGTTAYMSPEQARGLPMDQRTDIWAFGCVLYEMLSGQAAFGAKTISDTIARILEREPDWRALPKSTPRTIRELLRRCLRKDLQHRLHDIAGARLQIDHATTHLGSRRKIVGLLRMAAGVALALTISAAVWWKPWNIVQRRSASTQAHPVASIQHKPVLIIIADLQNQTGDPSFDRTLEPMLSLALEGAGFVNAYDWSKVRSAFGVPSPERFDEGTARELALKQNAGIVLSGSIDRRGGGYEISISAVQPSTGHVAATTSSPALNKDQILGAVTKVASAVRTALGEQTSEADQLFAMRSISAMRLDVVIQYAAGIELESKRMLEEARQKFLKAVELDPQFGLGYQSLAVQSRTLGKREDADTYSREALRYPHGMTERERLRTAGNYYLRTGDMAQCAKEFGELLARYPADARAHNQRAICFAKMRNMRAAMDEMRLAMQILPNGVAYRYNLALFAAYAGDFATAQQAVQAIQPPTSLALVALALSQLGQGRLQDATQTYEKIRTMDGFGASYAASGLGDLAVYEGRFSDAVQIFEQGAALNLAANDADNAATKFAAVAYANLMRGQNGPAVAAAEKALVHSKTGASRFLAARVFVQTGAVARARTEAARISLGPFVSAGLTGAAGGFVAEPEAYAKIIEAEIALKNEDPRQAIKLLAEANSLADTWLGHFDLGVAYLKVPAFRQADAEFDVCLERRGEALSLFDRDPTYGLFPPVFYYQGLAREGLNRTDFADSFRAYLDLRGKSTEDPLLLEVRKHVRR